MKKFVVILPLLYLTNYCCGQTGIRAVDSAIQAQKAGPRKAKPNEAIAVNWTPEMAKIYGTQHEKLIEDSVAKKTKNQYFELIGGFKVIYGEHISLYLQRVMKCTLLNKTITPTAEVFEFARDTAANEAQHIRFTLITSPTKRVTSAKITGSVKAMRELYTGFWVFEDDQGFVDIKSILADIVVLKTTGNKSSITITIDPSIDYSKLYPY